MQYIGVESIKSKLSAISGNEISQGTIKKLQEIENELNEYKRAILKDYFSQNNIVSLDQFFSKTVNFLGTNYTHLDKFYSYDKKIEYGKDSEIYVQQYGKIHIIAQGQYWEMNSNEQSPHYTTYLKAFRRLIDNQQDFLFYAPEDDSLFSSIFKTDEEIFLPYGSSMKYFPGKNQEEFRSSLKLAADFVKEYDYPLALRLK